MDGDVDDDDGGKPISRWLPIDSKGEAMFNARATCGYRSSQGMRVSPRNRVKKCDMFTVRLFCTPVLFVLYLRSCLPNKRFIRNGVVTSGYECAWQ